MATTAEEIKPGHWAYDRPAGVMDHYPADGDGDENLTASFAVGADALPEIRVDGAVDFRILVGEAEVFRSSASGRQQLVESLEAVEAAADGDSNDDEIEAYREALSAALSLLGMSLG
jgi:hypothetical protein